MSHETMNKLTNQSRKPMKSQQLKPLICKRMLGCRKEKDMSCKCHECGKQYKIDLIIPDELWEQIKPNGKLLGAGLLCSLCIMEKLEKMDKYDYWYITKLTKASSSLRYLDACVRRFEQEAGELHCFKELGCEEYIARWKFTLKMRLDQGEDNEDDHSFYTSLLEKIQNA